MFLRITGNKSFRSQNKQNFNFKIKMGHPGLEPGTNRLKAEYSTIELATLTSIECTYF